MKNKIIKLEVPSSWSGNIAEKVNEIIDVVNTGYFEEVKGGLCLKCNKKYTEHYNDHMCGDGIIGDTVVKNIKRKIAEEAVWSHPMPLQHKDFIKKAKELLPSYIDENFPKVEHSERCYEQYVNKSHHEIQMINGCIEDCPRKDYDGSRGRATVDIINYLIWLEKNL